MTSTKCSRGGCSCKLFTPNVFKPNYCAFCMHAYSAHHQKTQEVAESLSRIGGATTAEESVNVASIPSPPATRRNIDASSSSTPTVKFVEPNEGGTEIINVKSSPRINVQDEAAEKNGEKIMKEDAGPKTQINDGKDKVDGVAEVMVATPEKKKKKKKGSSRGQKGSIRRQRKSDSNKMEKQDEVDKTDGEEKEKTKKKKKGSKREKKGSGRKKQEKGGSRIRERGGGSVLRESSKLKLRFNDEKGKEKEKEKEKEEEPLEPLTPRTVELKELTKRMVDVKGELNEFQGTGRRLMELKKNQIQDLVEKVSKLNEQMSHLHEEEKSIPDVEQNQIDSLKETVVFLSDQLHRLKAEEREQKERKQRELVELEGKVSSLTYQILTLKRRTTSEVEALTQQLQQTKNFTHLMSDEMEKELTKGEYTLTYILRDLELKKTPLNESMRSSLGSLLNPSNDKVILPKRKVDRKVQRASQVLPQIRPSKKGNMKKWNSSGDLDGKSSVKKRKIKLAEASSTPIEIKRKKKGKKKGKKKREGTGSGKRKKKEGKHQRRSSGTKIIPVQRKQTNPRSPRKGIEALSEDIMDRILENLDTNSLLQLSAVSSHFQRICEKDQFWEPVYAAHSEKLAKKRKKLLRNADFVLQDNKDESKIDEDSNPNSSEEEQGEKGKKKKKKKKRNDTFKELIIKAQKEQIILRGLLYETKSKKKKRSSSLQAQSKEKDKIQEDPQLSQSGSFKRKAKGNGIKEDAFRWNCIMSSHTAKRKQKPPQFAFRIKNENEGNHAIENQIRLLLFGLNESETHPTKIPFLITKAQEGIHEEPAYHCNILTYGGCPDILNITCDLDAFYTLMTYDLPEKRKETATFYAILLSHPNVQAELRVRKPWKHYASVSGEWKKESAGGCLNEKTFSKNPFFLLTIPKNVRIEELPLCVMLEQKKDPADVIPGQIVPYETYIGFYIFDIDLTRDMGVNIRWKNCFRVHAIFPLNVTKDRSFLIVPTTFKPKQETSFKLHVFCDYSIGLELY